MPNKKIGSDYDAMVVLGGGVDSAGNLTQRTLYRLRTALDLFNEGAASHIIVTGGWPLDLSTRPPRTEAEAMTQYLLSQGVAAHNIITEDSSRDTIGNAYHTKQNVLLPLGWRKLAIVTSSWHLNRALYIFGHILGGDYELHGIASAGKQELREKLYELIVSRVSDNILDGTKAGDDAAIRARLSDPAYAQKYGWHPVRSLFSALVP